MVKIRNLSNGIRIVTEPMEHLRSVALGVWIHTGTVREAENEAGASHFIEHMLFKGTNTRSAEQIASQMDAVGGNLNAFTSKECTCFYAKVLDENLPLAMEMLADIVRNSVLADQEIEKEKGVVIDEIMMTEDTPEDLVAELSNMLYYADEPFARPILGTKESVRSFSRALLTDYMRRHYVPNQIVIACAGSFDEDRLMQLAQAAFGDMQGSAPSIVPGANALGGARETFRVKDMEQVHMTAIYPGFARDTEDQYALAILSNIIGGSMSSRLFQIIREQRGLAYSVYTYPVAYAEGGTFSVYAGTGAGQCCEVLKLMLAELENIRANGVLEEEFIRCKQQLKCSYVLGMESSGAHMNAIGKVALLQNREYNMDDTLNRIECVTIGHINRILPTVLNADNRCFAAVGNVRAHEREMCRMLERI